MALLLRDVRADVVHQMGVGGFGFEIQGPADVFTAEISALFTAGVIRRDVLFSLIAYVLGNCASDSP
jgi:hypothetical protein